MQTIYDMFRIQGKIFYKLSQAFIIASLSGACGFNIPYIQTEAEDGSETTTLLAALALQGGGACSSYNFDLPAGFPVPAVPADNCMTDDRVELGRQLFYDKRLSRNQTKSCASCHQQERGFTDGVTTPRGIAHSTFPAGELHPRNSQHLANVAYLTRLTWANSHLDSLEVQAGVPLFAESGPHTIVELGLLNKDYLELLRQDPIYSSLFYQAYPAQSDPFSHLIVQKALASFQRSMLSGNSAYDRYIQGDRGALSPAALRGLQIFSSEKAECFHCHGGFNFTDTSFHGSSEFEEVFYHANGFYTADHYAALPINQQGLEEITNLSSDEGKFKAPSLRNIGVTHPYMHDGAFDCSAGNKADLDACGREALLKVIREYADGPVINRNISGVAHPNIDTTLIRSFSLTTQEESDLVEFLMSLNDSEFLNNPDLSNPRPGHPLFGP